VPSPRLGGTRKRLGTTAPVSATVRQSLQLDWNKFNSSMGGNGGDVKQGKWGKASGKEKRRVYENRSKSDSPPPPQIVRPKGQTVPTRDLPIKVLSAGRGIQDWDSGGHRDATGRPQQGDTDSRATYPSSFVI
jgi:hypothetical protein